MGILGQLAKALLDSLFGKVLEFINTLRREGQLKKQGAQEAEEVRREKTDDVVTAARGIERKPSGGLSNTINRL